MQMVSFGQQEMKKRGEQINNKEHICQSFISSFKGDTAKSEVMQMWLLEDLH